mmetsp:Transcript_5105/g.10572  ORF Transcript_5105/g.10572 Transcript_5105/m.10572 type:complete len:489 (+) Transcript_5105:2080-3546(+)
MLPVERRASCSANSHGFGSGTNSLSNAHNADSIEEQKCEVFGDNTNTQFKHARNGVDGFGKNATTVNSRSCNNRTEEIKNSSNGRSLRSRGAQALASISQLASADDSQGLGLLSDNASVAKQSSSASTSSSSGSSNSATNISQDSDTHAKQQLEQLHMLLQHGRQQADLRRAQEAQRQRLLETQRKEQEAVSLTIQTSESPSSPMSNAPAGSDSSGSASSRIRKRRKYDVDSETDIPPSDHVDHPPSKSSTPDSLRAAQALVTNLAQSKHEPPTHKTFWNYPDQTAIYTHNPVVSTGFTQPAFHDGASSSSSSSLSAPPVPVPYATSQHTDQENEIGLHLAQQMQQQQQQQQQQIVSQASSPELQHPQPQQGSPLLMSAQNAIIQREAEAAKAADPAMASVLAGSSPDVILMAACSMRGSNRATQFCSSCLGIRRVSGELFGGHRPDGWCPVTQRRATAEEKKELRRRRQKLRRAIHRRKGPEEEKSA